MASRRSPAGYTDQGDLAASHSGVASRLTGRPEADDMYGSLGLQRFTPIAVVRLPARCGVANVVFPLAG
jgi:hypothetical protein